VTIGPIGLIFGLIAALFAYLQYWDKVDSSAILSFWGVLTVAYLICGYWLGFTARLSIASRFEVRHTNVKALTWMHILSSIGFFGILAVWYVDVPKLIVGWAVALCGIGWLMADLFVGRVRQEKPDFGRSND
jgi:membrane protein YqaA with SNARE-associated domain